MTQEVEDIIKSKTYLELTPGEREQVSEWAKDEEEYTHMKWFLVGTNTVFTESKIEASPALKENVLAHLTAAKKKKGFWLNSVGVFMLPENKKFYKKPAFQLGVAAVAVVGLLFFVNRNGIDSGSLALNEPEKEVVVVDPVYDTLNFDRVEESRNEVDGVQTEDSEDVLLEDVFEEMPVIMLVEDEVMEIEADEPSNYYASDKMEMAVSEPEEAEEEVLDFETDADDADLYLEESVITSADVPARSIEEIGNVGAVEVEKDQNESGGRLFNLKKERERNRADLSNEGRKKDGNKYTELKETASPGMDSTSVETIAGNALNAEMDQLVVEEQIIPKSMHVNKTKELNQLFYIVK